MAQDKLGRIVATNGKASTAPPEQPLKLAQLVNGRRGETRDLPFFGLVRVELLGAVESNEVEVAVYGALAGKLDLDVATADRFELERAWRTLAIAFRDPDDHSRPFGAIETWSKLDAKAINAGWQAYGDVAERLDPLEEQLSDGEKLVIESALKKKDAHLLRSFGVAKLSAFFASTDVQLSISRSPSSSSSASASES